MEERLQKIMAERGVASRRSSEKMILEGRVAVNGQTVSVPGTKADPEADEITVDGVLLPKKQVDPVYIMLYKPSGYITSACDERKRRTVLDLVGVEERIYPVGRLDYNTSGLLILTNDGELTNGLLHPKGEVPKEYECAVKGRVTLSCLDKLEKGVRLSDGRTAPARAFIKRQNGSQTVINITIHEGRNRQVRRMMEAVGLEVCWLKRRSFAGLTLDGLKLGEWRYLNDMEIKRLKIKAGLL
ncbi:MAG: pseudouridine synthase [Bacillota bacterium]|jgi:23S rRNA pseudouridine2605 synthase